MKITDVKVHVVPMSASWLSEGVIANPMSIYPEYKPKRSSWFGPMSAAIVEIVTDEGLRGLGTVGGGKGKVAAAIIDEQFRALLIGKDPSNIELLWEQMFRASQFYGRKGVAIEAISGVDLALWDLLGKALGAPVYQLAGGRTKDRIPVYVTGNLTERHMREGFRHVKLAVPHGPADGQEGMKKNIELVARTRELIGPESDIMLDCYMALDVPYAIALAKAVAEYKVLWIEEPVPPDQIDSYRRIKDAVPDILITGGEHEFTRYGFRDLIEKKAVDVLQPDIYRAGGLSELKKIAAMASAYDLPVIPHGVGAPTYHFVMSTHNAPRAEFVDIFAQGGKPLLKGEPQPQGGYVDLSPAPGFGYDLDEEVLSGKSSPALIW
ncbi:MAG TPA: enolase C-terminal domain-like protein [Terriglobia bacterium]|nr:enolase C-terminal domain-like protein [Terriglobia bacterium]